MMEDILAIVLLFGGGAAVAISFSPIGRAIADRIRGVRGVAPPDPAVYDELERVRAELTELHERLDFTERLLAQSRDPSQLPGGRT
ncbi:MAG TPA: hypothetical protein VNH46_05505 [Gemmatimonadales bacterium]|nr:hypothetical protein [Gemmatimonadales bacterium]